MSKILLVLFLVLSVFSEPNDLEIFERFNKFIKKYNKKYYSLNEYLSRFHNFKNNYISILKSENQSFKVGINEFSDMTKEEFAKSHFNLKYDSTAVSQPNLFFSEKTKDAPDSLDFRDLNRVTGVKDQGMCGASWAFSVIGNLEGLYAGHYGELVTFSENELIDCDTNDSGCNGGLMEYAFTWLKKNGIMTEADYPYSGRKGACKIDYDKIVGMTVVGFKKLGDSSSTFSCADEEEMKEFLYTNGPLSVALNGTPLQTYASGIIDLPSSKCSASGINHCGVLVGYGTDSALGLDYWIVKNHWGKTWGENGYFRIRRGNGTCGINCYVITAEVTF